MQINTQSFIDCNIVVPEPTKGVVKAPIVPISNKVAFAIATSIRKWLQGEANKSFSRPYIEELTHLYHLRHFNLKKTKTELPNVP